MWPGRAENKKNKGFTPCFSPRDSDQNHRTSQWWQACWCNNRWVSGSNHFADYRSHPRTGSGDCRGSHHESGRESRNNRKKNCRTTFELPHLSLFCTLIIAYFWRLVNSQFDFFSKKIKEADISVYLCLLVVRFERTSSLCRFHRRHQPQMGEPDSNGWSGTPGDSPQPKHTICVFLPSLIFYREDTWREPRGFPGQFSFSLALIVSQLGRFVKGFRKLF